MICKQHKEEYTLAMVCRARVHAILEQLTEDGALAVREALKYEAFHEGQAQAEEVGEYRCSHAPFIPSMHL